MSEVTEDFSNRDPLEICEEWRKNYVNAFEYCQKYNLNKSGMRGFIENAEKIKKIETQLKTNPNAHFDLPHDITPAELFGVPDEKWSKLVGVVLSTINKS